MPKSEWNAADEKLEDAIREHLAADEDDEGFLVDWIIVTAQHVPFEDGTSGTTMRMQSSNNQPLYRTAGLAAYAMAKVNDRTVNPQ